MKKNWTTIIVVSFFELIPSIHVIKYDGASIECLCTNGADLEMTDRVPYKTSLSISVFGAWKGDQEDGQHNATFRYRLQPHSARNRP